MRLLVFSTVMGLGGTEKAACRWAVGLRQRGHSVLVASFQDGPRRLNLEAAGVEFCRVDKDAGQLAQLLRKFGPEAIHAHAPGYPSEADLLLDALGVIERRIPLVQTNIFGQLENAREDSFVDFRLFVCWSSCVQAAQRAFRPLNRQFFRRASVAVNPLDAEAGPPELEIKGFRERLGVKPSEVLLGQICRPDPLRWSDVPLRAFRQAQQTVGNLKFLIREPPPEVAQALKSSPDADRFVILPVTASPAELTLTEASLDIVLHYSHIGESFGYGIAEPMNLGKAAVVNFAPWHNLGPLELVRPGECGYPAPDLAGLTTGLVALASDTQLRRRMGEQARRHIRQLADAERSVSRLESALRCAAEGRDNPNLEEDLRLADETERYLARHKFGQTWRQQLALRPYYYRVRFNQWRKALRRRFSRLIERGVGDDVRSL